MATKDEDFSFPTTTIPPPRFIGSPALWQPPASYPGTPAREDGASKGICTDESVSLHHQRRSFSRIEDCKKLMNMRGLHGSDVDDDDDVEEKMDMLWEDFNEEFTSRITKSRINGKYMYDDHGHGHGHGHDHDHGVSPKGMADMGCVKSKLSKATKKPGLAVFMKILKKFFLLRNSSRSFKKKSQ